MTDIIYSKKANQVISHQKKFSYENSNNIYHQFHLSLQKYEDKKQKNNLMISNSEKDSQEFIKSYFKFSKQKDKSKIKELKLNDPFVDLKHKYTQKGYKIPKFSIKKNNLFNPSILLIETSKIREYLNTSKNFKKRDKEFKYYKKIGASVESQLLQNSKKNTNKKSEENKASSTEENLLNHKNESSTLNDKANNTMHIEPSRSRKEIQRENIELKRYIKKVNEFLGIFPHTQIHRSRNSVTQIAKTTKNSMKGFFKFSFPSINNQRKENCHTPIDRKKVQRKMSVPEVSAFYRENDLKSRNITNLGSDKLKLNNEKVINYKTFTKTKKKGDPSDLMDTILKTKNHILNSNFEILSRMAVAGKKLSEGKQRVWEIQNLDYRIMRLDKELIRVIEKKRFESV